jgi:hypothetical protein
VAWDIPVRDWFEPSQVLLRQSRCASPLAPSLPGLVKDTSLIKDLLFFKRQCFRPSRCSPGTIDTCRGHRVFSSEKEKSPAESRLGR